jgi:hypothetical protein
MQQDDGAAAGRAGFGIADIQATGIDLLEGAKRRTGR